MLKPTTKTRPEDAPVPVETHPGQHQVVVRANEPRSDEAVAVSEQSTSDDNPLLNYSKGLLSREEAVRRLGLRDYAELLVALGDADLSMPLPPADEIEAQARTFVKLWTMG